MTKNPSRDHLKLYSPSASESDFDEETEVLSVSLPSADSPSANWAGLERRQQRELDRLAGASAAKTVEISIENVVPLLIEAAQNNRSWLKDFAKDTVRIDADLYEVLLAYQQLQNRSA